MPNLQILIVPESNHTGYKSNEVVQFFLDLFQPKKLHRKYRATNRTLDIHNVIKTELLESKELEKTVADFLHCFFMRSCAVYGKKYARSIWNSEDCSF